MKQRLLALALISMLAACGGKDNGATAPTQQPAAESSSAQATALDPILAEPKTGDLYAAKLSAFSAAEFGGKNAEEQTSYGLMMVVDVKPDRIMVITEDAAWPNPTGAKNDLNGDLADITWDESERIPIKRADLAQLVAAGSILEVRRLDK